MKRGWKWLPGLLVFVGPLGYFAYLGKDSHYANIPYNLWKVHLASYEEAKPIQHIFADSYFRKFLLGKTHAEIKTWFPHLKQATTAQEKEFKKEYEANFQKQYPDCKVYWGGWDCAFVFKDDRLIEITVCKG